MNFRATSIFSVALSFFFSTLSAVTLQDFYAPAAAGGAPTDLGGGTFGYEIDVTSSFSAAGTGKLVLVYSSKDESGNGSSSDFGGAEVTGITYDGADLDTAISHFDDASNSRSTVGIYYLDNVASDGILRIELADEFQTEFGFGLYALDGLKTGFQDAVTTFGDPTASSVTLTTSTGFLVQETARNNQSLAANGTDDWETLYSYGGPQSYRALSQYQLTSGSGEYFGAEINNGGNFKVTAIAAFEAVPEPSAFALIAGMFGFTWVMLRRRS